MKRYSGDLSGCVEKGVHGQCNGGRSIKPRSHSTMVNGDQYTIIDIIDMSGTGKTTMLVCDI